MRRISLALALLGAVAAAGCGGAGGKSPAPSSGNKGIEQATLKLVVRGEGAFLDPATNTTIILPKGGVITSTPAGINCGANGATLNKVCEFSFAYGTAVSLTATPNTAGWVYGWAGACTGTAGCSFTMDDTQFVGVRFAATSGGLGAHGPFTAHEVHGAEYLKLQQGAPGALDCTACHGGAALTGSGLAPSCATCHTWPIGPHMAVTNSSHNSGACARCHVGDGFLDYIGADNVVSTSSGMNATADDHLDGYTTATGYTKTQKLDNASFGKDMKCSMCHNAATFLGGGSLNSIRFAQVSGAGKTVTVDTTTALCGQCHTGVRDDRNIASVGAAIGTPTDWDAVLVPTAPAGGVRPHYLGAASTFLGADAAVYGQISGAIYTARNPHGNLAACTSCHSPHTGNLPADSNPNDPANTIAAKCGGCHNDELTGLPVATFAQLEESRQYGFEGDIDGDGVQESLKLEIEGMKAKLVAALRAYSVALGQPDMCFVVDATTGLADQAYVLDTPAQPCNAVAADKTKLGNNTAYTKFTARSLRAAFNFMAIQNDPGAWAHNPRYAIEILYDSIADLNAGIVAKVASNPPVVANGLRAFNGHFGAAEDATPPSYAAMIYHGAANAVTKEVLPTMGFTSGACYQCHGGQVGLDTYVAGAPAAIATIPAGGKVTAMQCSTCHVLTGTNMQTIRSDVGTVYFPPQKNNAADAGQVSFTAAQLPPGNAVCATCHSGRENGASITKAIGTKTDVNYTITSFTNPHYLGAAGMMLGSSGGVMFQYGAANTYTGLPVFWSVTGNGPHGSPHGGKCASCHAAKFGKHTFEIDLTKTVPTGTWAGAFPIAGMQPGDVNTAACAGCHAGGYALDPKITEFEDASAELLTAIRAYAVTNLSAIQAAALAIPLQTGSTCVGTCLTNQYGGGTSGQPAFTFDATSAANITGICYVGASNPYFFFEISGVCQNTATPALSFKTFNPKLLKAAFNYQWTQKEPGAWAHNEFYVLQVIYDSIVDLGGTPAFKVAAVKDATTHLPVAGDPLNRGY